MEVSFKRVTVAVASAALCALSVAPAHASARTTAQIRKSGRSAVGAKVRALHAAKHPLVLAVAARRRNKPPLGMIQARGIAGNYAVNNWDPMTYLPSYTAATQWDGIDGNNCIRWTAYRVDCVVSVNAQNYYYDPVADMQTGYAYCVGTLEVHKSSRTGAIWVVDEQDTSCDSTDDSSY